MDDNAGTAHGMTSRSTQLLISYAQVQITSYASLINPIEITLFIPILQKSIQAMNPFSLQSVAGSVS